jgi:uncharacterized membrane-anchored protein
MMQRAYEWESRPPTTRERIICGIWLVAFLGAMADDYAGWQLLRGYDKLLVGGLLLVGLLLIARLPGVRRIEGVRRPLTYWLIIGVTIVGAIILSLMRPES